MNTTPTRGTRLVQTEWGRRVEAEYRSAAITSELTLWLIRIGASPDLIDDGLRITGDELTHARMSYEVFIEAGGDPSEAAIHSIERSTLGIQPHPGAPLELDVLRVAVQTFCLGETVAVPLFSHLRRGCTESTSRAALDRILLDEVRHRDFGWDLLDWLLESTPAAEHLETIAAELPAYFATLEDAYGDRTVLGLTDVERAWGLAEPAEYAAILERTISRDYEPRFAEHGIDARAAWDRRAV